MFSILSDLWDIRNLPQLWISLAWTFGQGAHCVTVPFCFNYQGHTRFRSDGLVSSTNLLRSGTKYEARLKILTSFSLILVITQWARLSCTVPIERYSVGIDTAYTRRAHWSFLRPRVYPALFWLCAHCDWFRFSEFHTCSVDPWIPVSRGICKSRLRTL